MSVQVRISVEGVDQAIEKLTLSGSRGTRAVQEATKRAANDTVTLAKRLCPVDTGRLRASIRARSYNDWLGADVYTDVNYAPFVEFGTGERGASAPPPDSPGGYDLDWAGQYAQPFMWPAWKTIEPYYLIDLRLALAEMAVP